MLPKISFIKCWCWLFLTKLASLVGHPTRFWMLNVWSAVAKERQELIYYLNARNPIHWSFLLCALFAFYSQSPAFSCSLFLAFSLLHSSWPSWQVRLGHQQQFVLCPCARRKDSPGHKCARFSCFRLPRKPFSLSLWLSCGGIPDFFLLRRSLIFAAQKPLRFCWVQLQQLVEEPGKRRHSDATGISTHIAHDFIVGQLRVPLGQDDYALEFTTQGVFISPPLAAHMSALINKYQFNSAQIPFEAFILRRLPFWGYTRQSQTSECVQWTLASTEWSGCIPVKGRTSRDTFAIYQS